MDRIKKVGGNSFSTIHKKITRSSPWTHDSLHKIANRSSSTPWRITTKFPLLSSLSNLHLQPTSNCNAINNNPQKRNRKAKRITRRWREYETKKQLYRGIQHRKRFYYLSIISFFNHWKESRPKLKITLSASFIILQHHCDLHLQTSLNYIKIFIINCFISSSSSLSLLLIQPSTIITQQHHTLFITQQQIFHRFTHHIFNHANTQIHNNNPNSTTITSHKLTQEEELGIDRIVQIGNAYLSLNRHSLVFLSSSSSRIRVGRFSGRWDEAVEMK